MKFKQVEGLEFLSRENHKRESIGVLDSSSQEAPQGNDDSNKSYGYHDVNNQTVQSHQKKIIGSGSIDLNPTRICVMGVGGGGVNATNLMTCQSLQGVDIVAANTDGQTLHSALTDNVLPLGKSIRRALGAGGNPIKGAEAAREVREDIYEFIQQYDMLFLAAGLGGGTGTGSTPVIAEVAKEVGVLTVAVVTLPFAHEGPLRAELAKQGLEELESVVDAILVIPNDNIITSDYAMHGIGIQDGFRIADRVLSDTVQSLTDIITIPSAINIDFADIRECLSHSGNIAVAFGSADSEERKNGNAHRAVDAALKNTVISKENIEILKKANHIIVNTIAGPEVTISDYTAISDIIASRINIGEHNTFKHGYRVVESWGKKVQVTIIASHKNISSDLQRIEKSASSHSYNDIEHDHHYTQVPVYGKQESTRPSLRVTTDHVEHDLFEKILENNTAVMERESLQDISLDQYNTPAVDRLLGLSEEKKEDNILSPVLHMENDSYATEDTMA